MLRPLSVEAMTQINPFTGAIIQGTQVQARPGAEKERAIRRVQNLAKNAALQGDQLEHQVESTDGLHAANDSRDTYQQHRRSPRHPRREVPPPPDEQEPHIDLTA